MAKKSAHAVTGRITTGIIPRTLVAKTIDFVQHQLPIWRDHPNRPAADNEEELNSQLCKYLNVATRLDNFPMAHFSHEERQTGRRRVDMAAQPTTPVVIAGRSYSEFEPFLVMEGKRLPAPTADREREYVTGGPALSGEIQRFKLGLHGATLSHAVVIAYVQSRQCSTWLTLVNSWLAELSVDRSSPDWTDSESLQKVFDHRQSRLLRCVSQHCRIAATTPDIELTHLWIEMLAEHSSP